MNKTSKNTDTNVLLDVVTHIKDDNIIHSKKSITSKCCAAVKHTTKENSLIDLNNGLAVYLIKKDTTGKNDIFTSYVPCSKYPKEGSMCHIHAKTNPEKLIKMEDLIKNPTVVKASIDHEYYHDKGIRGAKGNKKNSLRDNIQLFSTKNINYILDSNNNNIIENLEAYAEKLVIKHITKSKKTSAKPNIIEKSNNELLEFLQKKNQENNSLEVSDNESVESDNDNNLLESSHQENIDENTQESDEEDIECVEIKTINNKKIFYLDELSSKVYEICEDEYKLVGKLKEINETYSQINHNDKKYSIFFEKKEGRKTYLICYLTGKEFDINLKPLK